MATTDAGTARGTAARAKGDDLLDTLLAPDDPELAQRHWMQEIKRAENVFESWHNRCRKILKRYRQQTDRANSDTTTRRYALLWANIETLKPAVYSRAPAAVASRRNKTANPVLRKATEVIERCTNTAASESGFAEVLEMVRDDYLLVARGTAWVRYEADFEEQEYILGVGPDGKPLTVMVDAIADERAVADYIHWTDFLHGPARFWKEVPWVARRVFMTRSELIERFGPETALTVACDHTNKRDRRSKGDDEQAETAPKATIYEIWSKRDRAVFWVAKDAPAILDAGPPPLEFDGFFPCPKPAYGTLTNDDLIPTPDYTFYQDQDEELDRLSRRIYSLLDALKLKGFYPGGASGIGNAMKKAFATDTPEMIPIPEWAAMGEGSAKLVFWPVENVIKVLQGCYDARDRIVQQVYEVTGMSDIVRGASNPNETATAQSIKAQWGSVRVRDRQAVLARFAQDCFKLVAEVVAERFQPETLQRMSEMELDEQVVGVLRDGVNRNFQIEVQSDALAQPDEDAEKQRRTEFGTMFGTMIVQAQQALIAMPPPMAASMAPVIGQAILFTIRGFKAGREMEDTVERAIDETVAMFQQMAQQPPPPPEPPPAVQAAQIKAEVDGRKHETEAALKARGQDMDAQLTVREQDIRAAQGIQRQLEPTIQ